MSANRINATLTGEQRDRANAALAEALPFLIDLSAKNRADSPKFGDMNRAFVIKSLASPRRTPTRCRAVSTSRNSTPTPNASKASTPDCTTSRPCTASSPIPTSPTAPWRTAWTTLAAASAANQTRALPRPE